MLSHVRLGADARAQATLEQPPVYAGEERGLRLALLEALAALSALQPTMCGGRLAAARAVPHLGRWLYIFLDEYLLEGDREGAPAAVVEVAQAMRAARAPSDAKPSDDDDDDADKKKADKKGGKGDDKKQGSEAAAEEAVDERSELVILDERRRRSASGSPAALLLLSVTSVVLRLRVGREHVDEAVALELIETCAEAALPIHAVLEARAASAGSGGGASPPDADERKGELSLVFELLLSVLWGSTASLRPHPLPSAPPPHAVAATIDEAAATAAAAAAVAAAAEPPAAEMGWLSGRHPLTDELLGRLLSAPKLRTTELAIAANLLAADPAFVLPEGVAPRLLSLIASFARGPKLSAAEELRIRRGYPSPEEAPPT